jgi:acyl carrier protein
MTPNNNVDWLALPVPPEARPQLDVAFAAARTATEEALLALWRDLLDIDRIGVDDDFFQLGGESLLAARLVRRVREEMQADLPMTALFDAPTVAELADLVGRTRRR